MIGTGEHARIRLLVTIGALLLALALAACGGGGEDDTNTAAQAGTAEGQGSGRSEQGGRAGGDSRETDRPSAERSAARPSAPTGPPASAFQARHHDDSGGGAEQFIVKGADNSVQEFGAEAGGADLEEAATALHGFLDARAERNWAAACIYLGNQAKRGFARLTGSGPGKAAACAERLAALSGKVPTATLREAALADVGSLRVEGDSGFLLYRGAPKGTIYAISMIREGGRWKVASLAGTPLN